MPIENVLIICSDEHTRSVLGCHGNTHVETPALDALAARGTRFANAYCNAPICVPSRASLATGLPIHEIPSWDNADPYHGQVRSFMHRARDGGADTVSIGKLHFRSSEDDNGFDEELRPMHVVNGTGTFYSLLRDPVPRITAGSRTLKQAGAGETSYTGFDREVRDLAVDWLTERGKNEAARPFLLNVSFVNPHPPYKAPPELFEKYLARDLPAPFAASVGERPNHPSLAGIRKYFDMEEPLSREQARAVTAAYYANVEFLDRNIGAVLDALERSGLQDRTLVLYFSDHGESLGDNGLYGKCNLYEGSAGIPLIAAGLGIPEGKVSHTAVQLLDIYPTVLDALGVEPDDEDARRSGRSLLDLASKDDVPERWVLIQQHCAGSVTASFALTDGRMKFIHCVGMPPQLFDLSADPRENRNLAEHPELAGEVARLMARLGDLVDIAAVDNACRHSQAARIAQQGGFDRIMAGEGKGMSTPVPEWSGPQVKSADRVPTSSFTPETER